MNSIKKTVAALALFGAAAGANAYVLTNTDGVYNNVGGIDWSSSGSALISSYNMDASKADGYSDTFNMKFEAYAANLQTATGANLFTPTMRLGTGTGYEYTLYVDLSEKATVLNHLNAATANVLLEVLSGTFEIFYQAVGNANNVAGTGFRDGIKILGGTIASSLNGSDYVTALQGLTNPGNITIGAGLLGTVTYQDLAYLNPAIVGTIASTTLQFGRNATGWTRPTCIDTNCLAANTQDSWMFQVDANQSFVPEPGTLALLGLGFLGLGAGRRRAIAKKQ